MFTFSKSAISVGPSFKKQDFPNQINLKLSLGELLTHVMDEVSSEEGRDDKKSPTQGEALDNEAVDEEYFEPKSKQFKSFIEKHLHARYLGIQTIHHSLKLDLLNGLKLTTSESYPELETVSYSPFALLLKSYNGYELVKYDANTEEGYSVGTKAEIKKEDILERQVSMLYLRRDH